MHIIHQWAVDGVSNHCLTIWLPDIWVRGRIELEKNSNWYWLMLSTAATAIFAAASDSDAIDAIDAIAAIDAIDG